MSRTLIIGDTHFDDKYPGYLEAQIEGIKHIILTCGIDCKRVLFLGDIFDKRSPKPSVILKVIEFLKQIPEWGFSVDIIRGNHDSETKADDGVTILNLLNSEEFIRVFSQYQFEDFLDYNIHYVPHYEDENTIKSILSSTCPNDVLFGHFGFAGCVNSIGDYDFSIDDSLLNCYAVLGHIHNFKQHPSYMVLGTPYATSYQEKDKTNYVGFLTYKNNKPVVKAEKVKVGPSYYVAKFNELESLKALKKPKKYPYEYRILRVLVDPTEEASEYNVLTKVKEKLHVDWVEIRFNITSPDYNKEDISYFKPKRELFSINEAIIEDYIDKANSSFTKEELLAGLQELRNENKPN